MQTVQGAFYLATKDAAKAFSCPAPGKVREYLELRGKRVLTLEQLRAIVDRLEGKK